MPGTYFRRYLLLLIVILSTGILAQPKPVTIGIVVDGPWDWNDEVLSIVRQEANALMSGEFDIRFPTSKNLSGEWTLSSIDAATEKLLNDPDVDIVLTMGVIASQQLFRREAIPKPVIAPFVIDVELQRLPQRQGASGVRNICYIAFPSMIERDIRAFQEIVEFDQLTLLMSAINVEAIPQLEAGLREITGKLDVTTRLVPVRRAEDALDALQESTEAVYIAPLLHLTQDNFREISDKLREKKIPSYSMLGRLEVEHGILASLNPNIFPRLGRRIALNLQRILLGEKPSEIPYAFSSGEELVINMATARAIGVYPSWALLTEAVLLDEQRMEVSRQLTLQSAVAEGLVANRDLLAAEKSVAAGKGEVSIARANLLPQVDLAATGIQIDEDRASVFQRERTIQGSASISQVIFSDGAVANYRANRQLQEGRQWEYAATREDIVQTIATAYLQLLSARTFERVRQNNLKLSRSNLELARVRESIGYSGRSEVYRWESQIASNRRDVISANAQRNLAEIQLNRLLNRPLEEKFSQQESSLQEAGLLTEDGRWYRYMNDPWSFKTLRFFLVAEGLRQSPELKQLEAAISAQKIATNSLTRAFFMPTAALQAEVTNIFDRSGAPGDIQGGGIPGLDLSAFGANADDVNYQFVLNLSLPLLEGGAKIGRRHQAQQTLLQLKEQEAALIERIEQRIRSAAHVAGSSYAGIQQAENAAEAARENLKLTVDAYSRGVLSIISLLDAQNAALQAEESAAGAVYQFLIDLLEMERSIGKLHLSRTDSEKAEFFRRLQQFFDDAGVEVR